MTRAALASAAALALAQPVAATVSGTGRGDVRVAGSCSAGAQARLRLERDDGAIAVRFRLRQPRAGGVWHVTLVHEHRVVWRTRLETARRDRWTELRRSLRDLPGSDSVTAHAWGPGALTCRATAILP